MLVKINASNTLKNWEKSNRDKFNMDFSPDSLIGLEQLMLSKIYNQEELVDPENKEFLLGVLFYVGEVFKRNDNIRNLSWVSSPERMPILSCRYYSNSWVTISQKFPLIIHERSESVLFNFFKKNISYFIEKGHKVKKVDVPIPGTDSKSYQHIIYNDSCALKLRDIESRLNSEKMLELSIRSIYFHDKNHLLVDMNTGYFFHFETKLNELPPKELEVKCNEVVSFWGDEDINGDFINEYMFILDKLIHDYIYIFDVRTGIFLN